jgi:intracellular septation protein
MTAEPKPQGQNHFFLISFLPAIAYWYLEEKYPLRVAIAGGLILAVIEIALEKIVTKHVHKISVFNFFLILFLGGLSLLGDEGIWFKLQPFFTGCFMGGYISYKAWRGQGILYEMMTMMPKPASAQSSGTIPEFLWAPLERRLGFFMIIYGFFMGTLAIWFSTDLWTFFKTIGFYLSFGLYMLVEMFFLRTKLKQHMISSAKRQR